MSFSNPDKTEQPTAKRRGEARDRGQVAKSPDLTGSIVLIVGLFAVVLMSASIVDTTGNVMTQLFDHAARPGDVVSGAGLKGLFDLFLKSLLKTVAPVALACMAAGIVANIAQVGLHLTPQAARPNFSRVNPLQGAKTLFAPKRALFEAAKSLAKVLLVGGLVALALVPDMTHMGTAVGTPPGALAIVIRSSIMGIAVRAAGGYLLIGIIDYVWQRRQNTESLKMTKQEVKDEARQADLPPEVKGALRRRQQQMARARMMAAVPRADVIVTNPTHYAVALEYSGDHPAPIVIAKGQDLVAAQIRRIAEEHDIPIVPDPPLARELYRTVEIDQMIPADMFAAVAQVLAFVYRLAARRQVGV
jgi:flagellar biosynthetic protein FlhB